jgi:hypothetical protein
MIGPPVCQIRKLSLYRLLYFPFPLPHIGHTITGKANCIKRHQRHVDVNCLTSEPDRSPRRNGRDLRGRMDAFKRTQLSGTKNFEGLFSHFDTSP